MDLLKNRKLMLGVVVCLITIVFIGVVIVKKEVVGTNEANNNTDSLETSTIDTQSTTVDENLTNPKESSTLPIKSPEMVKSATPVMVKGVGTITVDGKSTKINVSFPKDGGVITGTASGYCKGNIDGTFDKTTGNASGKVEGTCTHWSVTFPASGTFTGFINIDSKIGNGPFSGSGGQYTKEGSWKVVLE